MVSVLAVDNLAGGRVCEYEIFQPFFCPGVSKFARPSRHCLLCSPRSATTVVRGIGVMHLSREKTIYATVGATSRFAPNSFITVSALSPTLAIAASISGRDFLRRLHQYRANSLLEISTRFRALFADEVVTMIEGPL